MYTRSGFHMLEQEDLVPGMILIFRTKDQLEKMHKLGNIIGGWSFRMEEFLNEEIIITEELIRTMEGTRFKRGSFLSERYTFSLSMFKIKNEEHKTVKTTNEEKESRGISMNLEQVFSVDEKEKLRSLVKNFDETYCIDKLITYLKSNTETFCTLEKKYHFALRSNIKNLIVQLEIELSNISAKELLTDTLLAGVNGYSYTTTNELLIKLSKFNSNSSYEYVKAYMSNTLEDVIAKSLKTDKDLKLSKAKDEKAKLETSLKIITESLAEITKEIEELEA